jgi:[acyl-carrier-protein] S-malonyltransferase
MSIAFVFPGQGSQSIGMLADIADQEPLVEDTFRQASDTLGYDLWSVVQNGSEAELNRTEITQPALLTSGYAIWRIWQKHNGEAPSVLAGHSLGEYTALVCAGAMEFLDAVALVRDRGKYMQDAVPSGTGGMAAILGLDSQTVIKICEQANSVGVVSAVNFNSNEQTVIAGEIDAVNQAMELAKQAGAKRTLLLPVSVPSHCSLMQPAAEKFKERLMALNFKDAAIPVVQNVDARAHVRADEIVSLLTSQLHQPVLWVESINQISQLGCNRIIESGPGKVITGLVKRINREIDALALHSYAVIESELMKVEE